MRAHQRQRRLKKSKFVVSLWRSLTSAGREKTSRRWEYRVAKGIVNLINSLHVGIEPSAWVISTKAPLAVRIRPYWSCFSLTYLSNILVMSSELYGDLCNKITVCTRSFKWQNNNNLLRDISQPADLKLKVNSLKWLERKDDTWRFG